MKFFFDKIVFFIVIMALLIGVVFIFMKPLSRSVENSLQLYTLEKKEFILQLSLSGEIIPFKKALINAAYAGNIHKVFVEVGQRVKKGDPIISVAQSAQLEETIRPLRAPFPSEVVLIRKREGEYVQEKEDNPYLVRLEDRSRMFVEINVSEMDINKVALGQEALIKPNSLYGKTFKGKVVEVPKAGAQLNKGWRSEIIFPIKIEILNPVPELISGGTALVDLILLKKEKVLVIPHEYLLREEGKYFVFLEEKSPNEKRKVEIMIGEQNEEMIEILSGIKEGDLLRQVDRIGKDK